MYLCLTCLFKVGGQARARDHCNPMQNPLAKPVSLAARKKQDAGEVKVRRKKGHSVSLSRWMSKQVLCLLVWVGYTRRKQRQVLIAKVLIAREKGVIRTRSLLLFFPPAAVLHFACSRITEGRAKLLLSQCSSQRRNFRT